MGSCGEDGAVSDMDALLTSPSFAVTADILSPFFDAVAACVLVISASRTTTVSRGDGVSRISSAAGSLLPTNQVLVRSYCSVVTSSLESSTNTAQFGGTLSAHM